VQAARYVRMYVHMSLHACVHVVYPPVVECQLHMKATAGQEFLEKSTLICIHTSTTSVLLHIFNSIHSSQSHYLIQHSFTCTPLYVQRIVVSTQA